MNIKGLKRLNKAVAVISSVMIGQPDLINQLSPIACNLAGLFITEKFIKIKGGVSKKQFKKLLKLK